MWDNYLLLLKKKKYDLGNLVIITSKKLTKILKVNLPSALRSIQHYSQSGIDRR